jgi:hypothetical protein
MQMMSLSHWTWSDDIISYPTQSMCFTIISWKKKTNKATKGVLGLGMMQPYQEDNDGQKKDLEHSDQSLKLKVCI